MTCAGHAQDALDRSRPGDRSDRVGEHQPAASWPHARALEGVGCETPNSPLPKEFSVIGVMCL